MEKIWSGRANGRRIGRDEYLGPCIHHNRDGDEDAGDTDNGHSSRGVVARPPSVYPGTTDYRYYTIIYILGEEDRPTFLLPPARRQRRRGRVWRPWDLGGIQWKRMGEDKDERSFAHKGCEPIL